MDEPTLDALAARLTRLERENRWLKRIGGAGAALVAAVILMGQTAATSRTVDADRIVLRDAAGQVRVALGAVADAGNPPAPLYGLAVYDAEQNVTAYLYDDGPQKGARLFLLGSHSSTVVGAQADATLTLSAYKSPRQEWDRYVTQLNRDFLSGRLTAEDYAKLTGRGVTTAVLSAREGAPSLVLMDEQRAPRAVLGAWQLVTPGTNEAEPRQPSSLVLFGQDRKLLWKAP